MSTPDSKRFFCRYIQNNGSCRFSDTTCKFSHSSENTFKIPKNVCLFYLKGHCNKTEEQCRFLHISADALIEQLVAGSRYSGHSRYFGQSSIRANQPSTSREPARAARGQPAASVGIGAVESASIRIFRPRSSKANLCAIFCSRRKAPVKNRKRNYDVKPKPREEILCGICLEDVVGSQKSFGLLVNCNHSFCYDCILQWREQSDVSESAAKSCPVCRKPLDLVVPSRRFAIDADKTRVIKAYKDNRKNILCKHEKNGRNNCKNRTTCLFKHTLPFRETTALPNLYSSNLYSNLYSSNLNSSTLDSNVYSSTRNSNVYSSTRNSNLYSSTYNSDPYSSNLNSNPFSSTYYSDPYSPTRNSTRNSSRNSNSTFKRILSWGSLGIGLALAYLMRS